ncbi:hypothetical protein FQN57_004662 [Myotisia sp. PD_48]|nr:hypothetical protein FQN57_004662 [Myotisia sp. PD_48]
MLSADLHKHLDPASEPVFRPSPAHAGPPSAVAHPDTSLHTIPSHPPTDTTTKDATSLASRTTTVSAPQAAAATHSPQAQAQQHDADAPHLASSPSVPTSFASAQPNEPSMMAQAQHQRQQQLPDRCRLTVAPVSDISSGSNHHDQQEQQLQHQEEGYHRDIQQQQQQQLQQRIDESTQSQNETSLSASAVHTFPLSPRLQPTYTSSLSLGASSVATSPSRIKVRDLSHIHSFASEEILDAQTRPQSASEPGRQYEISSMPVNDVIEMVAGLLTKISTTNDEHHEELHRHIPPPEGASNLPPQTTSVLAFHGRNLPKITILNYLTRIHKYCPTTYEVFISLLIYFDRMAGSINTGLMQQLQKRGDRKRSFSSATGAASSSTLTSSSLTSDSPTPQTLPGVSAQNPLEQHKKLSNGAGGEQPSNAGAEGTEGPNLSHFFVVDSYSIHRLVIAGVTCSSKFFSDVFYTNSRYAKVGGLPLTELNHLELQFLLLNDFRLAIPVEELEAYGTMLVEFYVREIVAQQKYEKPTQHRQEETRKPRESTPTQVPIPTRDFSLRNENTFPSSSEMADPPPSPSSSSWNLSLAGMAGSVVQFLRLPVLASSGLAVLASGMLYFKQKYVFIDSKLSRIFSTFSCSGYQILTTPARRSELIYPRNIPAGARTDVPKPSDFGISDYEDLRIPTPDGESLAAYFIRPSNKRRGKAHYTVIMFHGNAGNIGHRLPIARVLEQSLQVNVLMVEYRGYGHSTGTPDEQGLKIDGQTALDYIRQRAETKGSGIIIYGQSLGGAVAIHVVGSNQKQGDIKGLILENTFLSIRKLIPSVFPAAKYLTKLCHQQWMSDEMLPKITSIPILFLSGLKDEIIPCKHMAQLYQICKSKTKIWRTFPSGYHNDTVEQQGYFENIVSFVTDHVCGKIPLDPSRSRILLIRWNKTQEIFLPKGRKNIGETLEGAALRETYEETGFRVTLFPLPIPTLATPVDASESLRQLSTVTEPFATTIEPDTGTQQEGEDFEPIWAELDSGIQSLTFDDDRRIAQAVIDIVSRSGHSNTV